MGSTLLTGATGFVGRQVLKVLLEKGDRVHVVARESSCSELAAEFPKIEKVISVNDVFGQSVQWWAKTCSGVDSIVHLAWYAEPGKYLYSPLNYRCLSGTLAMAEGALTAKVKHFVGVGTCFEYRMSTNVLRTDSPLDPDTPYSATKIATFQCLSQ
ncbi:MAG: NAD-dependent epimerase/dehydratase family protein, partial [Flavobacteriaceae bacterium]